MNQRQHFEGELEKFSQVFLPNQGTFAGASATGALAAIGGVILGAFLYEEISNKFKENQTQAEPQRAKNPYRNQSVPSTVSELEDLILSQPLTEESRKLLKALALLPEDSPLPRNLLPNNRP